VFVEDLGSLTGTRVNGERISGRRRLRDEDLVQIGDYDLAVVAVGSEFLAAPPPLPAARMEPNAVIAKPPPAELPASLADVSRAGGTRVVPVLLAAAIVIAVAIVAAVAAGALDVPVPPLMRP
jgi:hypothetical protein